MKINDKRTGQWPVYLSLIIIHTFQCLWQPCWTLTIMGYHVVPLATTSWFPRVGPSLSPCSNPVPILCRLLHSPSQVAVCRTVSETWLHHYLCDWWIKCIGGNLQIKCIFHKLQCIVSSCDWWEFPSSEAIGSPLYSPNSRQMRAISAVQGDCGRV